MTIVRHAFGIICLWGPPAECHLAQWCINISPASHIPAPVVPTLPLSCPHPVIRTPFLPHLRNNPLRNLNPFHTRRYFTTHRCLQQRLSNLHFRGPVIDRPPDMLRAGQGAEHGNVQQQRSLLAFQARPRPDESPACFRDQLLHRARKVRSAICEGLIDMLFTGQREARRGFLAKQAVAYASQRRNRLHSLP